jgi:hypothetical protein
MKPTAAHSVRKYEVRPRKDNRAVDLISDALPRISNDLQT